MRCVPVLVPLVLTTALVSGCGSGAGAGTGASSPAGGAPASGTVGVVAAENVWGDIARQVGGSHVAVTSIVSDPNADPHGYETDAKDAAAISSARLVVLNGLGYDDFASKLLSASPSSTRTVLTLSEVNGVTASDANPHLWYDPTYVKASAAAITKALTAIDGADAAEFAANEKTFLTAYQPYVDELARIRSTYAGTKVAYTERVAGYLVTAAGLVLGTPASFSQALEDGNDPSPADTLAFDDAINERQVKVLLYNGQVTDQQTDDIKAAATAAGVPVVGVAETIPTAFPDFQTWQLDQATKILTALGG